MPTWKITADLIKLIFLTLFVAAVLMADQMTFQEGAYKWLQILPGFVLSIITGIPQDLKEKAGVFCLHLPHGRDESTQKSSSPFQFHHLAADLQLHSAVSGAAACANDGSGG